MDSGFVSRTWILDSSGKWDSGFFTYSGFRNPGFRIPFFSVFRIPDSGFHKQKFSGFRKVPKNGQQKRATCFATLLQNELNSDVARFTIHVQTCQQPDLLQAL